jgi:hypothetical protein
VTGQQAAGSLGAEGHTEARDTEAELGGADLVRASSYEGQSRGLADSDRDHPESPAFTPSNGNPLPANGRTACLSTGKAAASTGP